MADIAVEKDVPLPAPLRGSGKYPWRSMAVGDSFFVPGMTTASIAGSVHSAYKRLPGWKFTSRTVDGGVRVWRIE